MSAMIPSWSLNSVRARTSVTLNCPIPSPPRETLGSSMASLQDRVIAVAQALIAAAAMSHAVTATDIKSRAELLHKEYGEYSKIQISNKIADEVKKRYSPGVSGSI